jgi:hypothetical protein
MLSIIYETLNSTIPINDGDEFTDYEKFGLQYISHSSEAHLLRKVTGQTFIVDPKYSIYSQTYTGDVFEFVSETTKAYFPISFIASDECLQMTTLSPDSLVEFMLQREYIFLPIHYESNNENCAHRAIIMISKNKEVCLVEPDDDASFFNNTFKIDISDKVELMLKNYFDPIGYDFKYISTNSWNPTKISFNKHFNNKNIGSGHCIILSYILCNLINNLKLDPSELYNMLHELNNDELLYNIKSYTIAAYKFLDGEGLMKNKIYVDIYQQARQLYAINSFDDVSEVIKNIKEINSEIKTLEEVKEYFNKLIE